MLKAERKQGCASLTPLHLVQATHAACLQSCPGKASLSLALAGVQVLSNDVRALAPSERKLAPPPLPRTAMRGTQSLKLKGQNSSYSALLFFKHHFLSLSSFARHCLLWSKLHRAWLFPAGAPSHLPLRFHSDCLTCPRDN